MARPGVTAETMLTPEFSKTVDKRADDNVVTIDTIFKSPRYFKELKDQYNKFKSKFNLQKAADAIKGSDLFNDTDVSSILWNILTQRMIFIKNNPKIVLDDNEFITGLTIRMKKEPIVNSCITEGDEDFAISNNDWAKIKSQFERLKQEGTRSFIVDTTQLQSVEEMIKQVDCERGICKDNRWKSGMSKMYYCKGQDSNPFYQALMATSVGGKKIRKTRKSRKTKRTKRRRTRRAKK
jgi:hypothetical protein